MSSEQQKVDGKKRTPPRPATVRNRWDVVYTSGVTKKKGEQGEKKAGVREESAKGRDPGAGRDERMRAQREGGRKKKGC